MNLQLYGDYRRKSYVVLFALILFLFIYFKLYTRADKEKTKQHSTLSLGSNYSLFISITHLSFFCMSFFSFFLQLSSTVKDNRFTIVSFLFIFLALKMNHNHDHDHTAMLENTNPSNPATVGKGLHMMMMAVSISFDDQ